MLRSDHRHALSISLSLHLFLSLLALLLQAGEAARNDLLLDSKQTAREHSSLSVLGPKQASPEMKKDAVEAMCQVDCKKLAQQLEEAKKKNSKAKVMMAIGAAGVITAGAAGYLEHAADAATAADTVDAMVNGKETVQVLTDVGGEAAEAGKHLTENLAEAAGKAAGHAAANAAHADTVKAAGDALRHGVAHAAHHAHPPQVVVIELGANTIHTADGSVDAAEHLSHAGHHHHAGGLCDKIEQELVEQRKNNVNAANNLGFGLSIAGIGLAVAITADMFGGIGAVSATYITAMKAAAIGVGISKVSVEAHKVSWSHQDMQTFRKALEDHCPNLAAEDIVIDGDADVEIVKT
eukprot:TRINITY_DN30180_c0_g1_i1.p1 TRINITY_DN30180_c0_g1~~TRINITY_DN30180_c0_g1_i1.p1  ORF type:complete len:368 (-),score=80.64 TRINITY_DN30180_c0_g1_i1:12-1064(-)